MDDTVCGEQPRTFRRDSVPRPRLGGGRSAVEHAQRLTAARVMKHPDVTVEGVEPVRRVWDLLQHKHAGYALVLDHGRCAGIVDLHDLWVSWAFDLEGSGGSVLEVLGLVTAVPHVRPQTPLVSVCDSLLTSRHHTVLVVDDEGVLHGVVTSNDVVRALSSADAPC